MAPSRSARAAVLPHYRLTLLGPFRLERLTPEGQPGERIALYSRKVESLLAYLALHPQEHSREQLAALLWGDSTDEQARGSLRRALNNLRQQLGDDALLTDREGVQLNPALPLSLDTQELSDLKSRITEFSLAGSETLKAIIENYKGDLLAEFYDEWILQERDQVRDIYLQALIKLAEYQRIQGNYQEAIEHAQRVLAADAANETAHQHLMVCYAAHGDRSAALEQFEKCKQALHDELGVEPSRETLALYEQIRKQEATGSSAARLTNLPRPLTSFVGREKEIQELRQFLPHTATLLTLTGVGGSGKTRLAIQVAHQLLGDYRDGVWWVDFSSLRDESLVPQQVAKALGVHEQPNQELTLILVDFLRSKQLLLLLDNCEHLINACADLVETIMTQCPTVEVLATSREGLGIPGETVWSVPTLALPSAQGLPQWLLQYEAIRLFVERAQNVNPRFALTEQNAPAVLRICRRLDGIPLALELAAARVNVLSVEQIAERLDDRFTLLTSGSRTALPRQQTLRGLIDWSYDLLSEAERLLFRRLAVFVRGCTLDAAEAVAGDDESALQAATHRKVSVSLPRRAILETIAQLVSRSLVQVQQTNGSVRYQVMETIREYAHERLVASGEAKDLQARHAEFFVALAERLEPQLRTPQRPAALGQLDAEYDNFRAVLAWALEAPERADTGLRMAAGLVWYWYLRNYLAEGRDWGIRILSQFADPPPSQAYARLLLGAGAAAWLQGEYELGQTILSTAVDRAQAVGDAVVEAYAHTFMGLIQMSQGSVGTARSLHEQSVELFRASREPWGIALALTNLQLVASAQDDSDTARAAGEEAIALFRELQEPWGLGLALNNLGLIAMRAGDYGAASAHLQEALTIRREMRDKWLTAQSLGYLAIANSAQGQYRLAQELLKESLTLSREVGNKYGMAQVLEEFAYLAEAQGQLERATKLLSAAHGFAESIGAAVPLTAVPSEERRGAPTRLRRLLGAQVFTEAWNQGRAMALEQAIEYAVNN